MTLVEVIQLTVQLSIALSVFCIALGATPQEMTSLFRKPGLLVRSLLAMNVIMPLFAVALVTAFEFRHPLGIALVALALSPIPPILPKKELKAGGTASSIIGLLVVAAVLSIVLVPWAIELLNRVFAREGHVAAGVIAWIVLISILAPLGAGFIVKLLAPSFAERVARPLSIFAMVLLIAACVPILITAWRPVVALIGNFTLVAIAAFVLFGLAVGHMLGGPNPDDRTVLALSTATRHPGVALAITHSVAPGESAVLGAVILYLISCGILSLPYLAWRRRQHISAAGA